MFGLSAIILITVLLVALVDFYPRLMNRLKKPIVTTKYNTGRSLNYLILPTVYGKSSYIDKLSVGFLKRYSAHIRVITTNKESQEFYAKLDKLCRSTGIKYSRVNMTGKDGISLPVNAYTLYRRYFENYEKRGVEANLPCILIDADTYSDESINSLVYTFRKNSLDMASLRCEVAKPKTILERLQAFEYQTAMDNRQTDHWLTSGACNMALAGVYKKVFSLHSNFFAGGDIEIGKIAQISGYKIRHIEFTFLTEAPSTFLEWFKQRIIWTAGGVRHHIVNLGSFSWHHLFITFYSSLLLFVLLPLRWIELTNYPLTLPLLVVVSWIYLYVFIARSNWHPILLLLPVYSFIQSMIIIPLGIRRYCKYAINQRSLGLLRFDLSSYGRAPLILFSSLNIMTGVVVIGLGVMLTLVRILYWAQP